MPVALYKTPLLLQSLQSDKEALQEGRGAVVKYRRTADGYIQIGTVGCGVLALITQPLSSPACQSRTLELFAWQRVISACQEPGFNCHCLLSSTALAFRPGCPPQTVFHSAFLLISAQSWDQMMQIIPWLSMGLKTSTTGSFAISVLTPLAGQTLSVAT